MAGVAVVQFERVFGGGSCLKPPTDLRLNSQKPGCSQCGWNRRTDRVATCSKCWKLSTGVLVARGDAEAAALREGGRK